MKGFSSHFSLWVEAIWLSMDNTELQPLIQSIYFFWFRVEFTRLSMLLNQSRVETLI